MSKPGDGLTGLENRAGILALEIPDNAREIVLCGGRENERVHQAECTLRRSSLKNERPFFS